MDDRMTYWLSYANENGCGGVVIVDLCRDEIGSEKPILAAVGKAIRLKVNPGPDYQVVGQKLPPDEIPDQFKHRLLGHAEVALLNSKMRQ